MSDPHHHANDDSLSAWLWAKMKTYPSPEYQRRLVEWEALVRGETGDPVPPGGPFQTVRAPSPPPPPPRRGIIYRSVLS